MPFEYKPSSSLDAPFQPERCKACVGEPGRMIRSHQCTRRKVKDGWCAQHHPDADRARTEASMERWRARFNASPIGVLSKAQARLTALEAAAREVVYQAARPKADIDQDALDAALEALNKLAPPK